MADKNNILTGSQNCPGKGKFMGIKRIGPGKFLCDVHVRGAKGRSRKILKDTTVHKARAWWVAEHARLRQSSSLTFQTVGEVLSVYLREHYQGTARYKVSATPYKAVLAGIGHYPLSSFKAADFLAWLEKARYRPAKTGMVQPRQLMSEQRCGSGRPRLPGPEALNREKAQSLTSRETQAARDTLSHSLERRPDTLNGYITIAKGAFNWARKYHDYRANPLAQVKHLDPENRQLWVYTPDQVDAILREAKGGPYYHFFLSLKYWGARRGEVLNIRGRDIFPDFIALQDATNKTKRGRTLPIPGDPELKRYLKVIPRDCPHAFCTVRQGGIGRVAITGKNALRWLKAHQEALGLPGATIHGFRRTVAVRMDENREQLTVIAAHLGHRDLRTLQGRYLPVSQARQEEAMERLVSSLKCGQNVDSRHLKARAA